MPLSKGVPFNGLLSETIECAMAVEEIGAPRCTRADSRETCQAQVESLGGNCVGSAHVVADKWVPLRTIPACDLLTFIGNNCSGGTLHRESGISRKTGYKVFDRYQEIL